MIDVGSAEAWMELKLKLSSKVIGNGNRSKVGTMSLLTIALCLGS